MVPPSTQAHRGMDGIGKQTLLVHRIHPHIPIMVQTGPTMASSQIAQAVWTDLTMGIINQNQNQTDQGLEPTQAEAAVAAGMA